MPHNIAIIGSGFLGLTFALRLAERGDDVTIFEAASEIGGLAAAWQIGEHTWDKHYHVTLASDSYTRKLIEDIGLGDEFEWVETKTGFYTDGKLYSMSSTPEFLRFPPLDLISKLRLGATIFYASRVKDWKALEKVSVESWLTKLSGQRTFDKIWKPLLKAKLGEAYKQTSAAFIWATIQRMYAARNSGLKKEMFGYVRGGYANVLARFAEVLAERGVTIRFNSPVERIERTDAGQISVTTQNARRRKDIKPQLKAPVVKYAAFETSGAIARGFSGAFMSEPQFSTDNGKAPESDDVQTFDQVIVTCNSNSAAKMLPQLSSDERDRMAAIRYQGIICASVLMRCSLADHYVTNITDDSPFTGVIEMTALVDKKNFDRNALVYLPKYVAPDDPLFLKTDDEIRAIFFQGLERMYPKFQQKDVLAFRVSRVREVFPLPVLNYSDGLPPMKTSVAGVHVINSSHIVNGTLNVNETVALAERFFEGHFKQDAQDKQDETDS
jgi:protoporphyrinogen oxidase